MKKFSAIFLATLLGVVLSATLSFSEEWTLKKYKLSNITTSETGITFILKNKKAIVPGCTMNEFQVSSAHAEFNLMAASLLTASANKKFIAVSFDETVVDCVTSPDSVVEVLAVRIY